MGRRRQDADGPNGLLLVDKPAGISSAAVVARVRRVFGGVKAGHTGTLDPFATGLLPLCLGEGTKLATWLTETDKTYEGVIRLGITTDTDDRTGVVTSSSAPAVIDDAGLAKIAAGLVGEIMQTPPAYSAIKRGGTPMYELARRGEAPELEARPVRIDRIELRCQGDDCVAVSIDCSKGFYVRSLARDLGEKLGCGAVLDSLRRTRVGRLRIEDAISLDDLERLGAGPAKLLSMHDALDHLRAVEITAADAEALRLGRQGPLVSLPQGRPGELVRLGRGGELVAVAAFDGRLWALQRVFACRGPSAPCPSPEPVLTPAVSQMEEEERNEANRRD